MEQSKSIPATEAVANKSTMPVKSIVETAKATSNLTLFAAGLKTAGLADVLGGKGPFTVFAPTDEAFRKLPPGAHEALLKDSGKLKAVLNYHIVSGALAARDMKAGEVMTLQGSTLSVAMSPPEVRVNAARVAQKDIIAANGVIHAIDAVILPKDWQLLAEAA
jgi:uncharacterized surface protein with fasciclin (FAS1) repeats